MNMTMKMTTTTTMMVALMTTTTMITTTTTTLMMMMMEDSDKHYDHDVDDDDDDDDGYYFCHDKLQSGHRMKMIIILFHKLFHSCFALDPGDRPSPLRVNLDGNAYLNLQQKTKFRPGLLRARYCRLSFFMIRQFASMFPDGRAGVLFIVFFCFTFNSIVLVT